MTHLYAAFVNATVSKILAKIFQGMSLSRSILIGTGGWGNFGVVLMTLALAGEIDDKKIR